MQQQLRQILKGLLGQRLIDRIRGTRYSDDGLGSLEASDRELILKIKQKNLTYLSNAKLLSLTKACQLLEEKNLEGVFLEAGCALGGSAILLASQKSVERPMYVYDVFGMIPPPTDEDTDDVHERYQVIAEGKSTGLGDDKYYGYEENLYELVQSNLENFGIDCDKQSVSLIKGLVQDTMHIDQPVALAHVDVDWYEPVMTCLERVFPKLVSGGVIILDDYYDWGGCRKATDEYLERVAGQYETDDFARALKIIKK